MDGVLGLRALPLQTYILLVISGTIIQIKCTNCMVKDRYHRLGVVYSKIAISLSSTAANGQKVETSTRK